MIKVKTSHDEEFIVSGYFIKGSILSKEKPKFENLIGVEIIVPEKLLIDYEATFAKGLPRISEEKRNKAVLLPKEILNWDELDSIRENSLFENFFFIQLDNEGITEVMETVCIEDYDLDEYHRNGKIFPYQTLKEAKKAHQRFFKRTT